MARPQDSYAVATYMGGVQNRPLPTSKADKDDSYLWRGPAYYSQNYERRRYIRMSETINGRNPDEVPAPRSAASYMTDSRPYSSASHHSDYGEKRRPMELPAIIQSQNPYDAWNKRWTGTGYYSPLQNTWSKGRAVNAGQANDARMYINEEDWLKYKHMVEYPTLPGGERGAADGGDLTGPKTRTYTRYRTGCHLCGTAPPIVNLVHVCKQSAF